MVEVGVPTSALQDEARTGDQADQLGLVALRADLELRIGDALLDGKLVAAGVTAILVGGHGFLSREAET